MNQHEEDLVQQQITQETNNNPLKALAVAGILFLGILLISKGPASIKPW